MEDNKSQGTEQETGQTPEKRNFIREIIDEDLKSGKYENEFSLEKVNKSGAVFNVEKLDWLNFQHLRSKPGDEVLDMLKEHLAVSGIDVTRFRDDYLKEVITAMRERVSFIKDYTGKSPYFFTPPTEYDPAVIRKRWKPESADYLKRLAGEFSALDNPGKSDFENALHRTAVSVSRSAMRSIAFLSSRTFPGQE